MGLERDNGVSPYRLRMILRGDADEQAILQDCGMPSMACVKIAESIMTEIDAYILFVHRAPRFRPLGSLIGPALIRPTFALFYHDSV